MTEVMSLHVYHGTGVYEVKGKPKKPYLMRAAQHIGYFDTPLKAAHAYDK